MDLAILEYLKTVSTDSTMKHSMAAAVTHHHRLETVEVNQSRSSYTEVDGQHVLRASLHAEVAAMLAYKARFLRQAPRSIWSQASFVCGADFTGPTGTRVVSQC